jgi:phosphoenolpyruvate synthase/pyruvate phosphate dikinase
MQDKLIQAARCALSELIGLFHEGSLPLSAKKAIVELYEALKEKGENVQDYDEDYADVVENLDED